MSLFNVSECVNGEPPDVLVPVVLRIVPARVVDSRGIEEQTNGTGVGTERKRVGLGDAERLAVSIPVNVGQVEESASVIVIEAFHLLGNFVFQSPDVESFRKCKDWEFG
jgi:hypothetical protein